MKGSHAGLCIAPVAGFCRRVPRRSAAARPTLTLSSAPSSHRRTQLRSPRRSALVITAATANNEQVSSRELLIVGPGVLGRYLARLWAEESVRSKGGGSRVSNDVVGITNTTDNHAALQRLGIKPFTKWPPRRPYFAHGSFPFVAFAAPPSGSDDYVADVERALEYWDGTGAFVFTSSAGVYAVEDGSACSEDSPTAALGAGERTDKLLLAEQAVLDAGGCVVRLAGLYHRDRGAHTFFLKQGQVLRWGGYTVNLLHYEDAASLVLAALTGQGGGGGALWEKLTSHRMYRSRLFLGCDNSPVSFDEMMAAVSASGEFPGSCTFTGEESPVKGKRMSNDATRKQLRWQPKYGSIVEFFNGKAKDWYYLESQAPAGTAPTATNQPALSRIAERVVAQLKAGGIDPLVFTAEEWAEARARAEART